MHAAVPGGATVAPPPLPDDPQEAEAAAAATNAIPRSRRAAVNAAVNAVVDAVENVRVAIVEDDSANPP